VDIFTRYLKRGTSLKREADKLSRGSEQTAVIIATQAIQYFMMAFACDDQARNLRGKLPQIEYWKTTADFIQWVINLQKERNETELEGLWYVNYPDGLIKSSIAGNLPATIV
jgi:hypothetical protein